MRDIDGSPSDRKLSRDERNHVEKYSSISLRGWVSQDIHGNYLDFQAKCYSPYDKDRLNRL